MSSDLIVATLQGKLHILDSDLLTERLGPTPLCLKCCHEIFIPKLRILPLFLRIPKSNYPWV